MSTEAKVPDTERLLREVSYEWKAGIDAQQPQRIAGVFTDDALFRAFTHIASAGKESPDAMRANHRTRRSNTKSFRPTHCPPIRYSDTSAPTSRFLTGHGRRIPRRVAARIHGAWSIAYYQTSRPDELSSGR
jgi:hypothetical protein